MIRKIIALFCDDANCKFCKKANILEEQLRTNKFNTLNFKVHVWKITYKIDPSILTIIPGHRKMSIEVKYAVVNNSKHEKELKKVTSGSAGYGLFEKKRNYFHGVLRPSRSN